MAHTVLTLLAGIGLTLFIAHMRSALDRNRRSSQTLFDSQGRGRLGL